MKHSELWPLLDKLSCKACTHYSQAIIQSITVAGIRYFIICYLMGLSLQNRAKRTELSTSTMEDIAGFVDQI